MPAGADLGVATGREPPPTLGATVAGPPRPSSARPQRQARPPAKEEVVLGSNRASEVGPGGHRRHSRVALIVLGSPQTRAGQWASRPPPDRMRDADMVPRDATAAASDRDAFMGNCVAGGQATPAYLVAPSPPTTAPRTCPASVLTTEAPKQPPAPRSGHRRSDHRTPESVPLHRPRRLLAEQRSRPRSPP